MSQGFFEKREVRMEPGPDGKLVPHVYIEKRPLNAAEMQEIMKEQEQMFSGFNTMFSQMDGFFASFDGFWKSMSDKARKLMEKHGEGQVGRGGRGAD